MIQFSVLAHTVLHAMPRLNDEGFSLKVTMHLHGTCYVSIANSSQRSISPEGLVHINQLAMVPERSPHP